MDWFKGKFKESPMFNGKIYGFPVNFPLNQSIEIHYEDSPWASSAMAMAASTRDGSWHAMAKNQPTEPDLCIAGGILSR